MRNFSMMELRDYEDFISRETYQPFTIYYWCNKKVYGDAEPGDWAQRSQDLLGAAVTINTGEPMLLMDTLILKEIIEAQNLGGDGGGGSAPSVKERDLIIEQWPYLGNIAGKRMGHCFLEGSVYAFDASGNVAVVDGTNCITGPADVRMIYDADDFSLSEPLILYMSLKKASGLFDESTTALTIDFGAEYEDQIKFFGELNAGKVTVRSSRSWNDIVSEVEETMTGFVEDLPDTQIMIIVSASEVQVCVNNKRLYHGGFILPNQPDLKNFRFSITNGVAIQQYAIGRLTKPSNF